MGNKSTEKQNDNTKVKNKRSGYAVVSLVIGILIILVMLAVYYLEWGSAMVNRVTFVFPLPLSISVLCADLAGLVSGIKGLYANKKGMSIAGIVLCLIAMILCIFAMAAFSTPY